jgi:hypothetical protein
VSLPEGRFLMNLFGIYESIEAVSNNYLSYSRQSFPFFHILKRNHNNKRQAYIAMGAAFFIINSTHNATILFLYSGY